MLIIKRPANVKFRVPTVSKEEQALVDAYRTFRRTAPHMGTMPHAVRPTGRVVNWGRRIA